MADPYIDQRETLIYGKFAREQMAAVCLGKIPEYDSTVSFAIAKQQAADAEMKAVLDAQPKAQPPADGAAIIDEARETIVRFGAYLDSLKGRPLQSKVFFGAEAPSVLARRRIVKLTAAIEHIHAELAKLVAAQTSVKGVADWAQEMGEIHASLAALEKTQRAAKVEKVDLAPDVAAARQRWLAVYNANKLLVRSLLEHAGKPELMPLVFDDLAEAHRAVGVTDELPPAPDAAPAPVPTP